MRKYRTKAVLKHRRAHSKSCIPMYDVKGFRWFFPCSFAAAIPSLSWDGSMPVSSPPWQASLALTSPTSWSLQCNPGFTQWLCKAGFFCTHLTSAVLLNLRGRFHSPLYSCILHDSKARTILLKLVNSAACWNLVPLLEFHLCKL